MADDTAWHKAPPGSFPGGAWGLSLSFSYEPEPFLWFMGT